MFVTSKHVFEIKNVVTFFKITICFLLSQPIGNVLEKLFRVPLLYRASHVLREKFRNDLARPSHILL